MAQVTANRILEIGGAAGTSAYTLNGAVTGYKAFSTIPGIAIDDYFEYFAEGLNADGTLTGVWEIGSGTWNSNGTISRAINSSSNNNNIINWPAGPIRIGQAVTSFTMSNITLSAIALATSLINTQAMLVTVAP
jgi:hypothetical protein